MKKLSFLLIILLLFFKSENANAQVVKSIGFRTGWASTFPTITETQYGEPINEEIYNRNMIYPELQTELFGHNNFSLLTNFAFISKGFNYPIYAGNGFGFFGGGSSFNFRANADYFTIMAAPKLSWKLNNISIYGFTGPCLGLLTSYESYYDHKFKLPGGNFTKEVLVLKPRTWGGTIGGGIEFKRKSNTLYYSIQGQFMHDFTKAVDYYNPDYDYFFKAKFQTLLLSFGIHYAFKKKEESDL